MSRQGAYDAYNDQDNTPTGFAVLNAIVKQDVTVDGDYSKAILPNDLCFGSKLNVLVPKKTEHVEAFASVANMQHLREEDLQFIGLARGVPQHQGRASSAQSGQFAIQVGGTSTIRCNSQGPLSKFAPIAFRLPGPNAHLPVDIANAGRVLAEIYMYDPTDAAYDAERMFFVVAKALKNPTEEYSRRTVDFASFGIFKLLRSIAFSFAVALLPPAQATAAGKEALAKQYGLIYDSASAKGYMSALESVFQMRLSNGTPQNDPALLAFKLDETTPTELKEVSMMQVDQVERLVGMIKNIYKNEQDRIIGYLPSGGLPGKKADIVLKS
jgi:hypothetical protein